MYKGPQDIRRLLVPGFYVGVPRIQTLSMTIEVNSCCKTLFTVVRASVYLSQSSLNRANGASGFHCWFQALSKAQCDKDNNK